MFVVMLNQNDDVIRTFTANNAVKKGTILTSYSDEFVFFSYKSLASYKEAHCYSRALKRKTSKFKLVISACYFLWRPQECI